MKLTTYQRPLLGFPVFPDFDNLFDGLRLESPVPSWTPETRIHQDKDSYRLETDLPGVRKEDLKVNVESDTLHISTVRKIGTGENVSELSYERHFRIPQDVESEKVAAELQDGVLSITLPKKEESKPRNLEIAVK